MKIAEVSMGNFKIISLGVCQMINVYSPKCLLTSLCTERSESVCVCVITALTPFFTERLKYISTYLYSVLFEDSTFNFLVDFSAKLLLHP